MIELLRNRRSVRKFQKRDIENSKLKILEEAILRSPSARNRKPWKFIFVQNNALMQKLAIAKPAGGNFLAEAPLGVVILGCSKISDAWIEDCSIAATILQLTAESLDLSSCWVQIRGREHKDGVFASSFIKEELAIHDDMEVLSVIALGYADEVKQVIPKNELDWEKAELLI